MANRQYQPYWQMIKNKGKLKIELNETGLEDATNFVRKFKKAITKEKWMDDAFKRTHPLARLQVEYDQEANTVEFILTDYYNVSNLIGDLND